MKHFLFILLFLPFLAWSQTTKEIKSDTTYISWGAIPEDWTGPEDSIWYEIRTITYSTGRTETITEPIGDTATVVNYFGNRTLDLNRQLANAATLAIQRPSVVRANIVSDKALTNKGLTSVFAALDTLTWKEYLNEAVAGNYKQDYTVTAAGTDYVGEMRRMNNGNIRFSFNGVNYTATPLSENWVRINNYPAQGLVTDLFRTGRKKWESINGENRGRRIIPALEIRKQ